MQLSVSPEQLELETGLAATLVKHNPFRRYEPPKPVVITPTVTAPVIDHLSKVQFVGVVQRDGVPQAWLFDSLTNNELLLAEGKSVSIAEFAGQLNSIDSEKFQSLAKIKQSLCVWGRIYAPLYKKEVDMSKSNDRVVISGMGIFSPIGSTLEEVVANLKSCQGAVRQIEAFNTDGLAIKHAAEIPGYDPLKHFSPADAEGLDRTAQFGILAARLALQDAKLPEEAVHFLRTTGLGYRSMRGRPG